MIQKEAGLILAARFLLYIGDLNEALRITKKIKDASKKSSSNASTVFEVEATVVEGWCTVEDAIRNGLSSSNQFRDLEQYFSQTPSTELDADGLMLWAHYKRLMGRDAEVLSVLNQVSGLSLSPHLVWTGPV